MCFFSQILSFNTIRLLSKATELIYTTFTSIFQLFLFISASLRYRSPISIASIAFKNWDELIFFLRLSKAQPDTPATKLPIYFVKRLIFEFELLSVYIRTSAKCFCLSLRCYFNMWFWSCALYWPLFIYPFLGRNLCLWICSSLCCLYLFESCLHTLDWATFIILSYCFHTSQSHLPYYFQSPFWTFIFPLLFSPHSEIPFAFLRFYHSSPDTLPVF